MTIAWNCIPFETPKAQNPHFLMMLDEAKTLIEKVEPELSEHPFVVVHSLVRNQRILHIALTERLRHRAKKGRVWKSPHFLSAFKNCVYGFDEAHARSQGGSDGIFLIDRNYRVKNEMIHKLYDQFLDKGGSGAEAIAKALKTDVHHLQAVRLVSHHMRLLGVLFRADDQDWLILVDYDDTKHG